MGTLAEKEALLRFCEDMGDGLDRPLPDPNYYEMVIPMSLEYIESWGAFEAVREARQNAMDADPEGYQVYQDGNTLIIQDFGEGIEPRHFFFGVGDKGDNARGQFREGLPLTLLVLTRLGLTGKIYSKDRLYWNAPHSQDGIGLYKICWVEGQEFVEGTRIEIEDWFPEREMYSERFVVQHDPRVIFRNEGRAILEDETAIFCKDIWVRDLGSENEDDKGYAFGYNLVDIAMNRDRGMVNMQKAQREIGLLWSQVKDVGLWVRLFTATKEEYNEQSVGPWYNHVDRDTVKAAFHIVYGDKAVLWTSAESALEATYRGANVIEPPDSFNYCCRNTIMSDREYIWKDNEKGYTKVPLKDLTEEQRYVLEGVKRAAKQIHNKYKVIPCTFESKQINGKALMRKNIVLIRAGRLKSKEAALSTTIHELAHLEFEADDMTPQMFQAIQAIGARLAGHYLWRK